MATCTRSDVDELQVLSGSSSVPDRYQSLQKELDESEFFQPVYVEDHSPPDNRRRYDYVKGLTVPMKCVKYTYTGTKHHLVFVWKVPRECSDTDLLNQNMKVRDLLKKSFPVYHS